MTDLARLTIPEAVDKLNDWLDGGHRGSFIAALFDCMAKADTENLKKLERVYPNLVYALKLWRGDVPTEQSQVVQLSVFGGLA